MDEGILGNVRKLTRRPSWGLKFHVILTYGAENIEFQSDIFEKNLKIIKMNQMMEIKHRLDYCIYLGEQIST